MKKICLFIFLLFFSCKKDKQNSSKPLWTNTKQISEKEVFEKVDSNYSKVYFENLLTPNISTLENLFNYDYFYNGAGVGIEDLNNDGLQDIFFCGNQVNNKLFLNLGELTFTDVSKKSGVNAGKTWANGVTFVDINNDEWLDIYISQGGPNKREERKNLLYLNLKDGTFKEVAEHYGLADMGISTQSVFFDFDKDGDLDCLVMNENEYYGVDPVQLKQLLHENKEAAYFNSSHLYRNDNGKFIDITKQAGIERPIFGLGLTVSDINKDGWLDIYIASDYYLPDALFINNHDGTFTDKIKEYTKQISYYGMGMDIADINNDLLQDIFVLDMAANDHIRSKTLMASMNTNRFDYLVNKEQFQHQYMYNSLQLNQSNNLFSNIAQTTQMANTDWSWSVLMSDYDHDSDKDVYITNGYRKYALDNDLQRKVFEAKVKYKGNVPLEVKKNLYESMPTEKLPNVLYENRGDLKFKELGNEWGLADYSYSNGAAQGDLDNDGDLDLVVNNIDANCFLYRNLTMENNGGNYLKIKVKSKLSESFATVTIKYDGKSQLIECRRVRGYRSAQENIAHFGIGNYSKIDTLTVKWPNGKILEQYNIDANTTVSIIESEAKAIDTKTKKVISPKLKNLSSKSLGIDYIQKENVYNDFEKEVLLPYKQSTRGPFITKGDLNGDQKEDFYLGGASGIAGVIYLQNANGTFKKKVNEAFREDRTYEDMESIFFDFDKDGDLDLFVVSGGNEFANNSSLYTDRLYLNDGSANFSRAKMNSLNKFPKSGQSVATLDYDNDGDLDLLVGNRIIPQNYPLFAPSTLWENKDGNLNDVTSSIAPELETFGIINDVISTDFNNDGWIDFIAVGEWTSPGFFKNEQGKFSKLKVSNEPVKDTGWWFSINETDINKDGLPDYVLGNAGLNIKFKASEKKPLKVFSSDFDNNGTNDIVLSKKYNGSYVPVRGRECSSQQMPFIKEKFETYSEFAQAKLIDIYGDKLNSAYERKVTEFQSVLLINQGNGSFTKKLLPIEAQLFPLLKTIFKDLNQDGYEDAILAGNIYNTEVETPRLDAISGIILLSNKKDGYYLMPKATSNLLLNGNIKDLEFINTKTNPLLIATQNEGPLFTYILQIH